MAWTAYCDQDDIENVLSTYGVTLRVADSPPDTLGDVLAETSAEIDEHCRMRYTPAMLALSDWVNQRAKKIAARHLCARLGNPVPQSLQDDYERILERLEMVRKGSMAIPDIAGRTSQAPAMSNHRVILRPFPHTVTERARSTGKRPTEYVGEDDPYERGVEYG